jgi:LysR family glycine cleavage system transcriptional activator
VYFPQVQRAFTLLRDATARIAHEESKGVFTLATLSSFAARWLVPRLGNFVALHPDIDLRLATSQRLTDFAREQVDAAIRYGGGDYPGLSATLLMTEELYPVCSPELLARLPLHAPEDLRDHTLLHDHGVEEWGQWLAAASVTGINIEQGHWYRDSSLLLQAAISGQGVALGRSVLAAEEIAAGRLVRPFDWSLPSTNAYYFVCPEGSANRAKVVAFREWLLAEAAREL